MSKVIRFVLVSLFVLGLFLVQAPRATSAIPFPPPIEIPGLAEGTWEFTAAGGELLPIDLEATPAPDWLEVMDWNILVLDGPAQVCHPFRAGQFGWVGEIFMLVGGDWVKVPTTVEWVPTVDGRMMACAAAPAAGTYALFGYYTGPSGEPEKRAVFLR